ncbi:MAG: hypothetical protein ACHQM6_08160, partial [Candidatus Kapaibacterium sp.]
VLSITFATCITPKLRAQEIAPEVKHSFSIGAEGGWAWSQQSGSFETSCKCGHFAGGTGNSGTGALFFEFELDKYFSFGAKLGLDQLSTSSSFLMVDTSTLVYDNGTKIATAAVHENLSSSISIAYLFVAPYVTFTPFGQGLFIRIAPEFGSLTSSNITATREIQTPIILSSGDTIRNADFQNGTSKETLENGPIQGVNKLRIAVLFSAGYDIPIWNNFSIFPEASYNLPLTNVSNSAQSTNWKIASYGLSVGVKYRFY